MEHWVIGNDGLISGVQWAIKTLVVHWHVCHEQHAGTSSIIRLDKQQAVIVFSQRCVCNKEHNIGELFVPNMSARHLRTLRPTSS